MENTEKGTRLRFRSWSRRAFCTTSASVRCAKSRTLSWSASRAWGEGRLLTADIDSIQGRSVGRVLVAAPAGADLAALDLLCDHRKHLGRADPANG
ncbi:MAG: hypothetical protein ACK4GC_04935 [Paracoccaceae bacterium]